jgi:hypothetical protein
MASYWMNITHKRLCMSVAIANHAHTATVHPIISSSNLKFNSLFTHNNE